MGDPSAHVLEGDVAEGGEIAGNPLHQRVDGGGGYELGDGNQPEGSTFEELAEAQGLGTQWLGGGTLATGLDITQFLLADTFTLAWPIGDEIEEGGW
jgi:hypothetical protein